MSEENQVSNEAVADSGTENVIQEAAQSEHIAESKKYRKRAQDAESQLADLKKQLQDQENAKLKEKEEFKTLAEKLEEENNSLSPFKEKYEDLVNQRKVALLERLPEDKREQFKNKELDVLEFMVSELSSATPNEPQARGTIKTNTAEVKNWTKLNSKDKRKNWGDILKSYTK